MFFVVGIAITSLSAFLSAFLMLCACSLSHDMGWTQPPRHPQVTFSLLNSTQSHSLVISTVKLLVWPCQTSPCSPAWVGPRASGCSKAETWVLFYEIVWGKIRDFSGVSCKLCWAGSPRRLQVRFRVHMSTAKSATQRHSLQQLLSGLLMTTAVCEGSTRRSQELCHCGWVLTKINWSAVWEVAALFSECSHNSWATSAWSLRCPTWHFQASAVPGGMAARLGRPRPSPANACTGCSWQQELLTRSRRKLSCSSGQVKETSRGWAILFSLSAKDQPLGRCCLTNLKRAAFSLLVELLIERSRGKCAPN